MSRVARAVAHPNIALAKYWGKDSDERRMPAVPSLSVTLEGMQTTTEVTFDEALEGDILILNGESKLGRPAIRVSALLDRVRARASISSRAHVTTTNDFPTAAGLASSASAFAALSVAASDAAGLPVDLDELSDLARQSSVSAARSLHGGFVELPLGGAVDRLIATQVAPADHIALAVLVLVTHEGEKPISSTEAMRITRETSPYYEAWVRTAPDLFERIRMAVLEGDFPGLGRATEQSALRMHAVALASSSGLLYWNPATVAAIEAVRKLRSEGLNAYFTIDAGPHVKVLVPTSEVDSARSELEKVPGVIRTITTTPGGAARLIDLRRDGA